LSYENKFNRILSIVIIKFIAPKSEEIPAKCREKIIKSTDIPLCPKFLLNGGYKVQPVPPPFPKINPKIKNINEGGRNQNLILLRRGYCISGDRVIKGINQFPKPPIIVGIIIKKIINKACAVTIELYNCPVKKKFPG